VARIEVVPRGRVRGTRPLVLAWPRGAPSIRATYTPPPGTTLTPATLTTRTAIR